jgi:alpha-glucosidase (family GH31 glycosyl hydrolase)
VLCCGVLCCADRFPVSKMRAFVDQLHSGQRRWVPIHDSAVAKAPGYPVYDEGEAAGIWIKDKDGQPYTGQVCGLGSEPRGGLLVVQRCLSTLCP